MLIQLQWLMGLQQSIVQIYVLLGNKQQQHSQTSPMSNMHSHYNGVKMSLIDFIIKNNIDTKDLPIFDLENFFGTNVDTSHPQELISDLNQFIKIA